MLRTIRYKSKNGLRALRCWAVPYVQSRIRAEEFRPVLCYLFTEWRCNVDCHYCFQFDNARPGMDLDTARRSIDWLGSVGCRVLAIMGGEPLLRKDLILEIVRYAARSGFFVYLPTNGFLMDEAFIDEVGRAGVAAVNLAVDCVAPRKGLPKALLAVEPQFRYLVKRQGKYGYLVFFNMNICRTNIKDIRLLTEIARQNRIATDYHLHEPPHGFVAVDHYEHQNNALHVTPDQYDQVDELLDWLVARQRQGWPMVNSVEHLLSFKGRMRGRMAPWDCRAGHNGALIRPDGTLSPCFDLITYDGDWGRIWEPKFDREQLRAVKEKCLPHCSSTCFYSIGHYYNGPAFSRWIRKHLRVG
jgi:MoaA/NifB/PqqE/SkfB family radical SAM enzyme